MPSTTEQHTNEALAAMADAAPVGLAVVGREGGVGPLLYANARFRELLENGALPAPLTQALTQGATVEGVEMPLGGAGGFFRVTVRAATVGGRAAAVIWVEDISAIRRAAEEAQAMTEMKSSFLASMSHEIRTPMQSIYGLLELIHDEPVADNVREMVAGARRSAGGLLEILDDILDLAKVEAGKIELDHFEVPLRTLAYGVIECMEVNLFTKPVKLAAEIDKNIPAVIMGDPTRLRQILINLIGNAIKFTEKGSVTVRVTPQTRTVKAGDGGLALRFEIVDTGIGMSPQVAKKLFQPFTQADNSTTRKFGGTGLGLSISHKLVLLMGGAIGVDSVEGQGSTFWFEIPTEAAGEQARAADLPSLDGLFVLSVEDHPAGAKEILSSLISMGAKVESVGTCQAGLDLLRKRPFDVAIVDQGLPDGQGIDLLRQAMKIRPFMGLILYTVHDDIGIQYTAKVIGAKYLPKPASRLGLGEAVKSAAKQNAQRGGATAVRRLLITEDTPSVRDVLKRQLDKLGVEVDFVTNGAEALRTLAEKRHGILFTDLHMPDMDGYQLVARIRANEEQEGIEGEARFPVVALTADVHLAQRQAYLSYGFDECLLKPVSLGQLRQLLIRWGVLRETTGADDGAAADAVPSSAAPDRPPALDRAGVVQQMGDFSADTVEMLKMFISMTQPMIDQLESDFARDDARALAETAHSLKGAAHSACCPHLGDLAGDVQSRAEKREPVSQAMIAAVRAEFDRAAGEISQLAA